jgi:hypothetical protein
VPQPTAPPRTPNERKIWRGKERRSEAMIRIRKGKEEFGNTLK